MAATSADSRMPGASAAAMATDGRKDCRFSALTRDSLLACGDFGTGGLKTCCNGGGYLRRSIDDSDASRFKRLALGSVAPGIAGDDCAGMAHFLARGSRSARNEGDHRLAHRFCVDRGILFHRAADFADDHDGIGAAVFVQ